MACLTSVGKEEHATVAQAIFQTNLFLYKYPNNLIPIIVRSYKAYKDGTDSVPNRRHIKFRSRGITHKKEYKKGQDWQRTHNVPLRLVRVTTVARVRQKQNALCIFELHVTVNNIQTLSVAQKCFMAHLRVYRRRQ